MRTGRRAASPDRWPSLNGLNILPKVTPEMAKRVWARQHRARAPFQRNPVVECPQRVGATVLHAEMVLQIMESLEHEGLIVDTGLRRGRYIVYAAASEGKQQEVT